MERFQFLVILVKPATVKHWTHSTSIVPMLCLPRKYSAFDSYYLIFHSGVSTGRKGTKHIYISRFNTLLILQFTNFTYFSISLMIFVNVRSPIKEGYVFAMKTVLFLSR